MATLIEMPKLSDTMTEGTLVKWLKKEGESVEVGDVIAEVETDKATMEMEAFDEGTLHRIFIPEGGKVPIGGNLALLLEDGESAPSEDDLKGLMSDAPAAPAPAEPEPTPAGQPATTAPAATQVAPPQSNGSERVKASPLAKKIAADRGLSLATIVGTGPSGRIVKKDVESAAAGGGGGAGTAAAVGATAAVATAAAIIPSMSGEDTKVPLSGMRGIIAERLLASKTQIPHFYLSIEIDAAPMMKLRKEINAASEKVEGNKYTVNDFVVKAIIAAAVEVPAVNASFAGDSIIQYGSVNLNVAIAIDDGLVTPVVRDAHTKSLLQLSTSIKDLAERARNKKLSPDEFQGGTITVSNLGSYGIDKFDAIINPPQAAIIAVGAIKAKPVVDEAGAVVAGQRMWIGMSGDHRVVDGAVGATYLQALKKLLENPALMLV